MAMRKSTRATVTSRNRSARRRDAASAATPASKALARSVAGIGTAVDAARTKLMRARAVLDCTRYVLLYDDRPEADPKRPSFVDAVDVARDLVDEVIDALDRVNLRVAASK
jgi:hypothetical protein